MHRRTLLAGIGSAGAIGLAGCLGVAGLDEHTANPVGVEEDARSDTGYEQSEPENLVIEESVGAVGYSEGVRVTNYLIEHEKAVDMGPLGEQRGAVFIVLSTPQISVVGQQVNPVEDKSTEELVELVASNYDGIGNVQHERDDDVSILGSSVTESIFVADAEFSGQDVEVNLHITEAVETDDDLVVSIGVYPRDLERRERENIETLMEAVSEDVDVHADGGGNYNEDEGGADDDTEEEDSDTEDDDEDEENEGEDEDGEGDEDGDDGISL
ncbi:DUF6517 family protein [Natrarchaeobius chitinivorans]|uniref:Uncharacterized protein n=1 Tax=Natrarchaeobius chitinivorans TaxID=1679083 RepID=A0A3N6LX99_NATCH|nr:DUF6517 family protein [Natrarchaeobius chitinivorans]RQG95378.1 hypothetical protein EA473_07885 [Natrarchaeobius chitinivorans]